MAGPTARVRKRPQPVTARPSAAMTSRRSGILRCLLVMSVTVTRGLTGRTARDGATAAGGSLARGRTVGEDPAVAARTVGHEPAGRALGVFLRRRRVGR